ncbi:hypothetical protein TEA_002459 [Camellia sinensis var. sinensis]|uniref:Uncharacterized protein n=1 Tax=Camellia sinensis var. sinensis TaxID=542762 RepID=A0A4S4DBJ6_CAMSN|nr:hypothetical protein TEA_002459 [Camellia sinensis var. sinensis]
MAYRRKQGVPRPMTLKEEFGLRSPLPPDESSSSSSNSSLAAKAIRASSACRDSSLSSAYAQSALSPLRDPNLAPPSSPPSLPKHSNNYEYTSVKSLSEPKHGFWGGLARKAKAIIEDDNAAQQFETPGRTRLQMSDTATRGQCDNLSHSPESQRKPDNPALQKGLDAITSSLGYIGGTIGNALEVGERRKQINHHYELLNNASVVSLTATAAATGTVNINCCCQHSSSGTYHRWNHLNNMLLAPLPQLPLSLPSCHHHQGCHRHTAAGSLSYCHYLLHPSHPSRHLYPAASPTIAVDTITEGLNIVENRTADIIQETRKLQIRKKGSSSSEKQNQTLNVGGTRQQTLMQTHMQPQMQTDQETQLKASRDVAMAMAAKAKLLLRELKTVKADLAFAKERCAQLEEENRIIRESLEKGDNPEDDDLVFAFSCSLSLSLSLSLSFLTFTEGS